MSAKGENKAGSKWTDEIDECLRVNWTSGVSARKCSDLILEQFGIYFSRMAIIGRADRKGYQCPPKPNRIPKQQVRRIRRPQYRPYIAVIHAAPATQPNNGDGLSLFDLGPHDCRYATSPDDTTSHLFCGAPQVPGLAYCNFHCRIAYRPTSRMNPAVAA